MADPQVVAAAVSELERRGVRGVRRAWVEAAVAGGAGSAAAVWETLLATDVSCGAAAGREAGEGEARSGARWVEPVVALSGLPDGVVTRHREVIAGPALLQLTEAVDVGNPPAAGDASASATVAALADGGDDDDGEWVEYTTLGQRAARSNPRMLRLALHDGMQAVHALEIEGLPVLDGLQPGCKLLLGNVAIRRGHLLLDSTTKIEVLGGEVTDWGVAPPDPAAARVLANRAAVVIELSDDDDDFA
ncbi:uncharacterized protein AMSG_04653 [Thecamonas trahens ATCC 50062]|uniref:RecQ-mediated genome instability protein 1 n=1 Tax=Thecamonas trahens ATCC 50062 TaxID=461836 RepID=A0A0L0DC74_THETB|nr:hypothetical protein AMSG_04653 [Thecamonas trahens ATCC 50062]KNC48908.1 hypothetical protein AMSG_04653 [Thecamonas trahens ATCC 50062]|eukprot:XP_013758325.1 hypothetical protein AMSG_04653 [Thecamonas trahens ATCC 50062]